MPDPIEVNYVPDGDDWQVMVSGRGKRLTDRAPGLIAARDRADQLVEKVAPEEKFRTVVHLLNGDALEFTTAYLTARLSKPTEAQQSAAAPSPAEPAKPDAAAAGKPAGPATPAAPTPEVRQPDARQPEARRSEAQPADAKPGPAAARAPAPRTDSDTAERASAKHGAGHGD